MQKWVGLKENECIDSKHVFLTPTDGAKMVNKYIFKFDHFCMVVVPK